MSYEIDKSPDIDNDEENDSQGDSNATEVFLFVWFYHWPVGTSGEQQTKRLTLHFQFHIFTFWANSVIFGHFWSELLCCHHWYQQVAAWLAKQKSSNSVIMFINSRKLPN